MSTDSINIEPKHLHNNCRSCEREFSNVKDFPLVRLESFEAIGEATLQVLKSNDKILKDFASMKEHDLKELNLKREYCVDLLKWEHSCTSNSAEESKNNDIPVNVFENFQQHVESRSKVHQFQAPFDFLYKDPNTAEEWKTTGGNYDGEFGKATRWSCYLICKPGKKVLQLLLVKYLEALEQNLMNLKGKLVKGAQFLQDYLTGHRGQINLRHVQDDLYVLEYYLTTGHMGAFASIKESADSITSLKLSCFVKK